MILAREGQWQAAEAMCSSILAMDADRPDTHLLLGVIYLQTRREALALTSLERSIALDADQALAYSLLGDALLQLRRASDALRNYDEALRREPAMMPAQFGRANALFDLGQLEEAVIAYDRLLSRTPDHAEAWFNRGNALLELRRLESALQSFDRAIRVRPHYATAHNNRGSTLIDLDRLEQALTSFEAAIVADPRLSDARRNRALTLEKLGRRSEALQCFETLLSENAADAAAEFGLSSVLFALGRRDDALRSVNKLLERLPDSEQALRLQGEVLSSLQRHRQAALSYAKLLGVSPEYDYAAGALHHAQRWYADWNPLHPNADPEALRAAVMAGRRVDVPFSFLSVADDPEAQLRCARTYSESRKLPRTCLRPARAYRHSRLRVAYVSGDVRAHPIAHLLTGVLERHDPGRFETIGVSLRPADSSAVGQRMKSAFHRFVDVAALGDRAAAELIRGLEVDIAVDLMGHTNPRLGILAYRPAPIQVQYLGFPGTMGAPFMDYILADSFVVPAQSARYFSEQVVYLPDCFQANDGLRPPDAARIARRDVGLPPEAFVFCCFNNVYKLNAAQFEQWMQILRCLPDSVLWLFAPDSVSAQNLRREASRRDVNPERLVFARRVSYTEHLARLPLADLFLDTLPFNGGATTSDALRQGVPVLTCAGRSAAARMSGSLLRTLGLQSLITENAADYQQRAFELAGGSDLATAKARLGEMRAQTRLFDSHRFCRHLELCFERMLQICERDEAPMSFAIDRQNGLA